MSTAARPTPVVNREPFRGVAEAIAKALLEFPPEERPHSVMACPLDEERRTYRVVMFLDGDIFDGAVVTLDSTPDVALDRTRTGA